MKRLLLLVGLFVLTQTQWALAQCAMCRSSVEVNANAGDTDLASGLNTGILYLFFMPYLIVGTLVFLWIRHSRKNGQKKKLSARFVRG